MGAYESWEEQAKAQHGQIRELESALDAARSERDALQERVEAGVREWDKERAEHVNDMTYGERRLLQVEAERDAARSEVEALKVRAGEAEGDLNLARNGIRMANEREAEAKARASAAEATAERLRGLLLEKEGGTR